MTPHSFELTTGKVMRATKDSAALDVFYSGDKPLWITDRVTAISTGVTSKFTPGLVAILKEKSGLALKGIEIKAGVIDADYRDEWLVLARNPIQTESIVLDPSGLPAIDPVTKDVIYSIQPCPNWKPFRLNPGDKIAQFLLVALPVVHVYSMPSAEVIISEAIRAGGFGSTDNHTPLPDDPRAVEGVLIPTVPEPKHNRRKDDPS